ncbi:MAG TPA: OmpA family protein [Methylomirabilota bacterium]|nr:OmpA family protein [Methylomirabilota bacterium]
MKQLLLSFLVAATLCSPSLAHANLFSTTVMRPTPVDAHGVIRGALPKTKTSYYFSLDAQSGDLLTQLSLRGTQGVDKQLELAVLDRSARVQDSYWVHGGAAENEATRSFPIDDAGLKILRITVQGPETGRFCVLLGGSAFSPSGEQNCWPSTASGEGPQMESSVSTTNLHAAKIEVVESKCEQRLRIGSDVLFDFDKSEIRGDADAPLSAAVQYLKAARYPIRIEGHTDSKGTDSYNQTLSEERAASVRRYLVQRGVDDARIRSVGFGKSHPVASNTYADGSDDPDGRQKNRRVEIVLDTCERTAQIKP